MGKFMSEYLFTSESVTEGHPDKACDAFSDAILDDILSKDKDAHVACESLATKGLIVISGEVRTNSSYDVKKIVREAIRKIGYNSKNSGVDPNDVEIITKLHEQSSEIAQGVDSDNIAEQGAGDQGLMFGFACNETPELMPLPIQIAHRLTERLTLLRKDGTLPWLRPDGKSQVSVKYNGKQPISIDKTVIATQHDDMISKYGNEENELAFVESQVIEHVIRPVLDSYRYEYEDNLSQFYVLAAGDKFISNKNAEEKIKEENVDYFIKVFINNLNNSKFNCNDKK